MRKIIGKLLIIFSLFLIVYTIIDNNRIIIVEQEIEIENLPDEIDGFTILQVTDLHEKEFGKNQDRLIEKINSISYDVIVFTGDMLKSNKSTNYKPFYTLLEGIDNKEKALFVPGNTDPDEYSLNNKKLYKDTDFISGMEQSGVLLLESVNTIQKGLSKVHFVDVDFSIQTGDKSLASIEQDLKAEDASNEYSNHQIRLFQELSAIEQKNELNVLIGLTHYPVVDARLNYLMSNSNNIVKDYDLILAGHYHGGQIRIPFIGALFIPEGWYARDGLFPPQDRVKGLWEYKEIKQYVSTGLGSSDAISLLKFRLFNTPEINLLTLREKK
ncbi:metallophosphoesterase [Neobacillus sp. FSL H8-0543]|uniref:metallophosphoesterase n=1 Tax=Neobacillus sp. FSL H8-0543 TaxID=2954672 RepID=UPI0031587B12